MLSLHGGPASRLLLNIAKIALLARLPPCA